MERLTDFEIIAGLYHTVPLVDTQLVVNRLATYEDTGLKPEEIKYITESGIELKCTDDKPNDCTGECCPDCSAYRVCIDGIPISHIRELVKAEHDDPKLANIPAQDNNSNSKNNLTF